MKKLTVELKDNSYDILIEDDILFHLPFYIQEVYKEKKIFIITDDLVASLHLRKVKDTLSAFFDLEEVVVPHGETSKNIEMYIRVCEELLVKNIRRNHLLLALGGGVIGDLTGFVAATLYRGVPYIGMPTSLLSQMDSSIGGKTGVDFFSRKNIIGAFKQPLRVFIDPQVLKTLDLREMNNGMGELIKHAVIGNPTLFERLKKKPAIDEEIIYESLMVKKRVVELDPSDLNERMFLNFGHTFGHVIELKYGYKHGEAVALGMLMAIQMGMDLKVTDASCYQEVESLLLQYDLPAQWIDYQMFFSEIGYDKKNLAGKMKFIFIEQIGKPMIYEIEEDKLREVM